MSEDPASSYLAVVCVLSYWLAAMLFVPVPFNGHHVPYTQKYAHQFCEGRSTYLGAVAALYNFVSVTCGIVVLFSRLPV